MFCVYISFYINRLKSRRRALPGEAVSAELLPCGSFGGVAAVRGPASEPEPRLFLPETSCPGVLRRRACDPAMRDIYIINCKYLAGEGAVSEPFIWICVDLLQFLGVDIPLFICCASFGFGL